MGRDAPQGVYLRPDVLRLEAGAAYRVAFAGELRGLWFHWSGSTNVVCQHGDCPAKLHDLPRRERGYGPGFVWLLNGQSVREWTPVVLEFSDITLADFTEADMRDEVWSLKSAKTKRKRHIVRATFEQRLPVGSIGKPWDVAPYLQRYFNCLSLPWHALTMTPALPEIPTLPGELGAPPELKDDFQPAPKGTFNELRKQAGIL